MRQSDEEAIVAGLKFHFDETFLGEFVKLQFDRSKNFEHGVYIIWLMAFPNQREIQLFL